MTDITFAQLGLPDAILEGIQALGFTHPTPVQAAAIPQVLLGKDLLVQAKTGSGKTFAFGLPILARLDTTIADPQVLVIVPTRELAMQVSDELNKAKGDMGILISPIYGGVKLDGQMTEIAWSSIIVGTPGRLRDHLTRGNLFLDRCTTVILDEADEMLDMGFKDDLEYILAALPKPRVTLLFSATFPKPIERIAQQYMHKAEKIAISSGLTTPVDITHHFIHLGEQRPIDALIPILRKEKPALGLIFCNRKSETAMISRQLRSAGIRAGFINGNLDMTQRTATMDQFKRGEINILVATDVAARGLDINGITHVFNLSVPHDTESYVHRSGRTGRAGHKGTCTTLITPEDERYFTRIKRDLGEEIGSEQGTPSVAPPKQRRPFRRPRVPSAKTACK